MHDPPLVFTHLHKCAGSSLRQMLYHKFEPLFGRPRMHVPEITCDAFGNLPMLEERGEPLPENLLLLADHSPFGLYDERVLAEGEPFRMTLLRQPIDRFESYFHFCAIQNFIPEKWSRYASDLPSMPDADFIEMCDDFKSDSEYAYWFDPLKRDPEKALSNLLGYDVVARYDDLEDFCAKFNARNPYGLTFQPDEEVHVNQTLRPSRMTTQQREIARDLLASDHQIWNAPAVQRAMEPTPSISA